MTSIAPRDRSGRFGETHRAQAEVDLGTPASQPAEKQWTCSFRDAMADDEYNAQFSFEAPPRPRNPEQIVSFWRGAAKSEPDALERDIEFVNQGINGRYDWPLHYYARESGTMPDAFPGWTYKQKKSKFEQAARNWVNSIPDPRAVDWRRAMLDEHYVPRRSQRTPAVLTFFAQDHASTEMVYANADISNAEQAAEILAFADDWSTTTGSQPGLLVFDSQLTTYAILDQLTTRGITWLTCGSAARANADESMGVYPCWWTGPGGSMRRDLVADERGTLCPSSARPRRVKLGQPVR